MVPYLVVIINGKGGCGKDTLISKWLNVHHTEYDVYNNSTIGIIRKAAAVLGYDPEDKSERGRKFLSEMKKISTEYNNYPARFICDTIRLLIPTETEIKPRVHFIHCREPKEIEKIKSYVKQMSWNFNYPRCVAKTLLITSPRTDSNYYGNASDDEVELYDYDQVIDNDDLEIAIDELQYWISDVISRI